MRRWVIALMLLLAVAAGCKRTPEGVLGTEIRHGDLGITVTGYELRYLDLQAESGAVVTTRSPVLLIHMMVTNYTGAAVRYDTRDSATVGQQGLTPLLFVATGDGADWRTSANNVPLVSTQPHRYLGDPIVGLTTIGANETVHDVLLFERPPETATELVLSLPPTLFGATVEEPLLIRLPYTAPEPVRPPAVALGEPAEGDGYTFRLDAQEIRYWPNTDRSAFSEEPLLGLRYTIANTGGEALRYVPPHTDPLGTTAPVLSDGRRILNRTQLREGRPAEQVMQPVMLQPGDSMTDVALFERPEPAVTELLLLFPGHNVGRRGQVRVRFAYEYSDPPMPAELVPQPRRTPTPPEPGLEPAPGPEAPPQE
jgi:hypothetical protein